MLHDITSVLQDTISVLQNRISSMCYRTSSVCYRISPVCNKTSSMCYRTSSMCFFFIFFFGLYFLFYPLWCFATAVGSPGTRVTDGEMAVAKRNDCSSRGPRFNSLHSSGHSQLSELDLTPSYRHTCRQNTNVHKMK